MPLLHGRITKTTYQEILDKVDQRLSGWSASHLSLAGRITLTQSVLQAVPIYAMQSTFLPASTTSKLEQMCRRFLWSGNEEHRKMSLIGWDRLCQPKAAGGLGFKKLALMNKALMMKIAWLIRTEPEKLVVRVLLSKYGFSPTDTDHNFLTSAGSPLWKAVGRAWEPTRRGLCWSIGDGMTVSFWWDCWVVNDHPLANLALSSIPSDISLQPVAQFTLLNGSWNWNKFSHLLPHHVLLRIASIMPPSPSSGTDKFFWAASPSGRFTIRSAYMLLAKPWHSEERSIWKLAWSWKGPQRIRVFIWQALHSRLKTKCEIASRGIAMDAACDRCGAGREDTLHVLRDCPYSMAIWKRLLVNGTHQSFFLDGLTDWLVTNLHTASSHGDTQGWSLTFGVVIWRLWFWRNKFMFNHEKWECDNIMLDIYSRVAEIQRLSSNSLIAGKRHVETWIRWSSPTWPWVKLNTDGARKDSGVAGAGGLVRDYRGVWQFGFCINLGACSVLTAEIWGLYHGLCMAWQRGFRRIWVEVDSKAVTQILENPTTPVNEHHSLILAIRELLSREWVVKVNHIYREANIAADFLASFSLSFPLGLQLLTVAPPNLQRILHNDMSGVAHSRLVVL
ncbi:hypothetical protein AB3S75_045186 [Citrus x aurantiifolia]